MPQYRESLNDRKYIFKKKKKMKVKKQTNTTECPSATHYSNLVESGFWGGRGEKRHDGCTVGLIINTLSRGAR